MSLVWMGVSVIGVAAVCVAMLWVARRSPWSERFALRVWAWAALHPRIYALGAWWAARYLRFLGGGLKRITKLPFAGRGWTLTRDFPAPQGKTFRELYRKRSGGA